MERVRDLGRTRQRRAERLAIGPRQVHDRPAHPASPSQGATLDPSGRPRSAATSDYVEQDASAGVHHGGAPVLLAVSAASEHQDLVQAQGGDPVDARRVRFEQRSAPAVHRSHHRVPAGAQLGGDLADRTSLACPAGRVARCAAGDPRPGRRDRRLLVGERAYLARPVGAAPAALCPHQTHRAPERRQIRQAHLAGAVTVNPAAAAPTARTANEADTDLKGAARPIHDAGHCHTGAQAHNDLQRSNSVNNHREPPELKSTNTSDSGGSLPTRPGPPTRHPTLKDEAPIHLDIPARRLLACGMPGRLDAPLSSGFVISSR